MSERPTTRSGKRAAPRQGAGHRRERPRAGKEPAQGSWLRWVYLVLGILIAGLVIVVIVIYADLGWLPWFGQPGRGTRVPSIVLPDGSMVTELPDGRGAPAPAATVDARAVELRAANVRGSADAPVLIVEYADFQCAYCREFFGTTEAQLVANEVAAGKVRFAYKHLAILGQESIWAAEAAECAADQNRFWDYHDELFRRALESGGKNAGSLSKGNLQIIAQELQLDLKRFIPCLQNDETFERVRADTLEAGSLGLSGTPAFLLNDQVLIGAQPYAKLAPAIDRLTAP